MPHSNEETLRHRISSSGVFCFAQFIKETESGLGYLFLDFSNTCTELCIHQELL